MKPEKGAFSFRLLLRYADNDGCIDRKDVSLCNSRLKCIDIALSRIVSRSKLLYLFLN